MQREIKILTCWHNFKKILYYINLVTLSFLIPSTIEAGPGNYIPTSSTTSQICLGDALAISTINNRKFSKLDFKKISSKWQPWLKN